MVNPTSTLFYRKINAIAEIGADDMDKLFEIATHRQLRKGDFIVKEGQICNAIFFVEKGYLKTFIDKDGTEINTGFTFEGAFTTNLKSLRSVTPSDTCIQAGEPASIYEFKKDELLSLYQVSPEIESFGRKLLEHLLIEQEEHAKWFRVYTPAERYSYLEAHHPELLQRVSLTQLASYLGMARETLSRIRNQKS